MTSDVKRCCRALDDCAWVLDKHALVDLVMESRSRAARYMVIAWYHLQQGKTERSRTCFAEAQVSCEDEEELACVLYVEAIALLCMGDVSEALVDGDGQSVEKMLERIMEVRRAKLG